MIEIITLSSRGQVVLPSSVREAMGLEKEDRFLMMHDDKTIVLEKISQEEWKKEMLALVRKVSGKMRDRNIKESAVQRAIDEVRKENRQSRS